MVMKTYEFDERHKFKDTRISANTKQDKEYENHAQAYLSQTTENQR